MFSDQKTQKIQKEMPARLDEMIKQVEKPSGCGDTARQCRKKAPAYEISAGSHVGRPTLASSEGSGTQKVHPAEAEAMKGAAMNELMEMTRAGHPDGETDTIYTALAKHHRDEAWGGQELIAGLQTWADRFIAEFKLDIDDIALCIDQLSINRYGHFRRGHNGFGLRGEIAINSRYLTGERELWEVLGTLLHELLHAWQETHGTPGKRNHHNAEFQAKARELGLNIDRRGVTGYAADSPFKELLRKCGVSVPDYETKPPATRPRGESKLKKWSCGCTTARVAVADFRARCLKCGNEFKRDGLPAPAEANAGGQGHHAA
jgi:hypothetical protein